MKARKLVAFCLAGMLAASALTGCGINENKTAITMEGQTVTLGLVNFMCRYQQAYSEDMYTAYFGQDVWTQDLYGTGSTMADSVKDNVTGTLHELMSASAHAADYGVELSDAEKQAIADAASAFIGANSADALKEMGATQAIVEEYLTLATIRNKVYNAVIADVDTNVSDEEANMRAYSMVTIAIDGEYDNNNNYKEYTEAEVAAKREAADQIAAEVKEGTTLEDAAEAKGYSATTGTYAADNTSLADEVKTTLDSLAEGQVSGVIETEKDLYIVRLDAETDADATDNNRENIIATRKSTLYNDTLAKWQENDGWNVKSSAMKQISFKNHLTTTADTENAGTEAAEEDATQQ